MATGNMLQGQARGKVGDIVFSVVKGQQVSKVYNAKPANPKTDAQITQRVKLGAAVGFYKRNTMFFPFAFQKQPKESDYNAFIRENINVSPYISRQGVVGNQIIPAPYQMTRGNLADLPEYYPTVSGEEHIITANLMLPEISSAADRTVKMVREAIGAQFGDMLTCYIVASTVESDTSHIAQNKIVRGYAKYTFKAEDDLKKNATWDEVLNCSNEFGGSTSALQVVASFDALASEFDDERVCCGCVFVLSRKVSGQNLQVSSSAMVLSSLAETTYERYRSEAMLQEAKNSYGVKSDAFLSPQKPNIPQP